MKKIIIRNFAEINHIEPYEGETIENKVRRVVDNNEPISDGAPIIYTNRDEGVIAGYNVRTDRWDVALMAMDAAYKVNVARSKDQAKVPEKQDGSAASTSSSGGASSTEA